MMQRPFYFASSMDVRSWAVRRPVVRVGEHDAHFFYYVDRQECDKQETIVPPKGLYGKEFLALDYRDPFALLAFQQQWGPISGLRARPSPTFDGESVASVAVHEGFYGTGSSGVFRPDGLEITDFMFNGIVEAQIRANERYGTPDGSLKNLMNESWVKDLSPDDPGWVPEFSFVATFEEVSEAVCDAQTAILAITNCLREDYTEDEWEADERLVRECVRYCSATMEGSIVALDVIEEDRREGICTLMQYLFISLAKGLVLNNAYRTCQNAACGRLFTPKEYGRRNDARYCSEECQIQAKHLRSYKRKRPTRKPVECQGDRQPGRSMPVSWSSGLFPFEALTWEYLEASQTLEGVLGLPWFEPATAKLHAALCARSR